MILILFEKTRVPLFMNMQLSQILDSTRFCIFYINHCYDFNYLNIVTKFTGYMGHWMNMKPLKESDRCDQWFYPYRRLLQWKLSNILCNCDTVDFKTLGVFFKTFLKNSRLILRFKWFSQIQDIFKSWAKNMNHGDAKIAGSEGPADIHWCTCTVSGH